MKELLRLLGLFRPYTGWILLGVFISLATLLANVTLMAVSGWFIASMAIAGAAGTSMNYFTPAAMIRATAIIRTAGRYLERLVTHEATFRLLAELRVWFYRHLEPLAPSALEDYRSGDLLSRIRADIDTLDNLYVRTLVPLAVGLSGATLLTLFLYRYDRLLAITLVLALVTAGVVLPLLTAGLGRKPGRRVVVESAALRTTVVDGLQGAGELMVYGAEKALADRARVEGKRLIQAQRRMSVIGGLAQAAMLMIANLAMLAIVLMAVPMVRNDAIAPPELAMLALFSLAAFEAVVPLPDAFRLLGQTVAAARRIFSIVDANQAISEPGIGSRLPEGFNVRLKSVDFSYSRTGPKVLRNLDLEIKEGEKVAIVGPTGSGKSSVIQLLLKFKLPQSGTITLGNVGLDRYKGENLRDWISVVPQKVHLFNTTISDNLRVANPQARQHDMERACKIAQIHDFILSQPDGYRTWVGETGARLSGGQARRIALARALLRDCHLLVLDEPGEGLDPVTEQKLLAAILNNLDGRSLLLITHRQAALDRMDEILYLEDGEVVERGHRGELSDNHGQFHKLFSEALPDMPD